MNAEWRIVKRIAEAMSAGSERLLPFGISNWRDEAECLKHPDLNWVYEATELTKQLRTELGAVCQKCPVILDCRMFALKYDTVGWWGNMTQRERDKWARQVGIRPLRKELSDE